MGKDGDEFSNGVIERKIWRWEREMDWENENKRWREKNWERCDKESEEEMERN